MNNEKFSYYLPPFGNTIPERSLTLREVWEFITGRKTLQVQRVHTKSRELSPVGTLEECTRIVRNMSPEEYSDKMRGKGNYLPSVTFGGEFSQRRGENLLAASGLICLDIDKLDKLDKPGMDVETLREQLSKDTEIGLRLLFVSPSGKGLKLVCKTSGKITDAKSYTREFKTLNAYISQKYDIPIGEGAGLDPIKDITRSCLLCYDPQSVFVEGGEFRSELHPLPDSETKSEKPKKELLAGGGYASTTDLDSFKKKELMPALFDKIDQIFPSMEFRYRRNKWESPYNLDGTEPQHPRPDKSVITKSNPGTILENGEGNPTISVFDKFMNENSLEWKEAIRQLASIAGLEDRYKDLTKKYAQEMNNKGSQRENKPSADKNITPKEKNAQSGSEKQTPREKFAEYLTIPPLKELAKHKKTGVVTPYTFKTEKGEKEERYTLTSGGLNIVGAMSSHGKSRFLQNLALGLAEEGEGSVLYFALEESEIEVLSRIANIAADTLRLSDTQSNTEAIMEYFRTDGGQGVSWCREERKKALDNFRRLYEEKKIIVKYIPDLQSDDLCELIKFLSEEFKARAVFIDYLQAITPGGYNNARTDELRKVCNSLAKTAKKMDIPVVLAAQLNRSTGNPTNMSINNLAESADISRYADTALLLWDSARPRDILNREEYLKKEEAAKLQDLGFNFEEKGYLYAVLNKNKGGRADLEAVWKYTPQTGKVEYKAQGNTEEEPLLIGLPGNATIL